MDERAGGFDARALHVAINDRRQELGLSWAGASRAIWELSAELNARRGDHPISPATLTGIARRGDTSCQHALFFLRWLDRLPESFVTGTLTVAGQSLPPAGTDRRLRWHLHATPRREQPGLFEAMDESRRNDELTWAQLATLLGCTPNQLSGLRTARYAVGMRLAMRITQWLERPAADFVYAARW